MQCDLRSSSSLQTHTVTKVLVVGGSVGFGNRELYFFDDDALRAASILENNDMAFCTCCPAANLDLEKPAFLDLIFLQVAILGYLVRVEHR